MADNAFPILPQFQGDYLDAQRKMAIAQALQQQAFAGPQGMEGWNGMRIVPRMNPLSGLASIGQALLANKAYGNAIDTQRQLGQNQWQAIQGMFQPQQNTTYVPTSQDAQGNPTYSLNGNMPSQQTVTTPSSMNPGGLNPQTAAMWYMRDPAGYMKEAVAPFITPTDATKMAIQGGQDPRAANIAALAKSNYIAPPEGRPGGYTYMPQIGPNGQVSYTPRFNQPIPEGGMPIYDAAGNQIPGAAPLPGAAGIRQTQAASQAAGGAQYDLVSGVDANGSPIYRTRFNAAQDAGGTGNLTPQGSGFSGYTPPSGGGFRPSLPTGSESLIKGYTDRYQAGQDAARNAPADIQAFRAIDQAASQAKTGVGFDRGAYWKSMASMIPGIDPNNPDKVNADIIQKYSEQVATRNGGRSDAALDAALHSITNSGMAPESIHELTPSLIGLRMSDLGRSQAATRWLQAHGNAPASLGEFESNWNKNYDPDIYRLQAMNPAQQQAFVRTLSPQQRSALNSKRNALAAMGALDVGQ